MAGKDAAAMATATRPKSVARRLWRVARAVLYMLRRGVLPSGRKLAMDLNLLLRRGKIAGKALGGLLVNAHHHHHHHHHHHSGGGLLSSARSSSFSSCRSLDPALAVHEPSRSRREVEFSCSNTPFSAADKSRHHRDAVDEAAWYYDNSYYDAADVAKVFDMLNNDDDALVALASTANTTPSPALWSSSRHPRVTDTPFTPSGSDAAGGEQQQVDRKADEFIRRFYEQLRAQKSRAATPDTYGYAAGSYAGHSPRPVAAGIA